MTNSNEQLTAVFQELLHDLKDQKPYIEAMAEGKDAEYKEVLLGAFDEAYYGLWALYFASKGEEDHERLSVSKHTEWISTAEAAEILGIGRIRVTQLINAGQLRAEKVGNRYSVDRASVEERVSNPPKAGRRW